MTGILVAAFYLSDNCSGSPVAYVPSGCLDRSQGGKRIQSVKVIESPFNRQAEVVEVAGEGDEAE